MCRDILEVKQSCVEEETPCSEVAGVLCEQEEVPCQAVNYYHESKPNPC